MAGAPSHADDWRCPLHCHSMTALRLLKIDGGELGQKRHVNSDQKTQPGHVAAHGRTASKSSAWSHGEIVAVWKRGSNLLAAGRDEIPVMQERKKISTSFNTNAHRWICFFWPFFPEKDNIFLGGNGKLRHALAIGCLRSGGMFVCFFLSCITLFFSRVIQKWITVTLTKRLKIP